MIHPLFKCFGSKWQASLHLPKPVGATIIEPFAGGAGYSLRYHLWEIVLSETDVQVYSLWKWLIEHSTEQDIRDIPLNVPEGTDIRTLGLSGGQELLLKFWQRTNNVGDCWTISKWGHLPGQWTANARARVAEESQEIKHWLVLEGPGEAVLRRDFGDDVTWFIDPIYQYNYAYRQERHDYPALGKLVENLKGQVIACEALCPNTGARPTWLPFEDWQSRVTSRRVSGRRSSELLYHRRMLG